MTFEQLYANHFPDVYRFALWMTRDSAQADDVASETFIRAWSRRDRLRTDTLKGYLFAIARNVVFKHRRHAGQHEKLPEELVDRSPDPQRAASARSDLDRVTDALYRLPAVDRAALLLRTEHALPYDEIARVLEISVGAARVKVYRARRRLLDATATLNGGG